MTSTPKKQNEAQTSAPAVRQEKTIVDQVLTKVQKFVEFGEIKLPSDYSPENALKSAYLILQETKNNNKAPVLEACSKESIANSLLDMVVQGLSPMKKQCAFIAFGDKLTCLREYAGTIALARRYAGLSDFSANVIYEGDSFKYSVDPQTGRRHIVEHIQEFENVNIAKIKGAYAVLIFEDKLPHVEIMTIQQIQAAWKQGAAGGTSPAHTKFPDQMAIKTVISRACKNFINSSDDGNLHLDEGGENAGSELRKEVHENAAKEELNIESQEFQEVVDLGNAEQGKDENGSAKTGGEQPAGEGESKAKKPEKLF